MLKQRNFDLYLPVFEKMNKGAAILQAENINGQEQPYFQIIYANPSYFEIFNLERNQQPWRKFPLSQFLDPKQAEQIFNLRKRGDSEQFEYFEPKSKRWYMLSFYCPQESYLVVMIDDITQQKLLKQELAENEETLRITLEIAGEGLSDWYFDKDLIYHNKRWAEIVGLPEDSVSHDLDFFMKRVHPEDVEKVTAVVEQAKRTEEPYFCEHRMVLDDGRIIWVEDRGIPMKNKNGKLYRMIGCLIDITGYKKAQQDLFLENEIIQSTLLSVGDGVITTDIDGNINIFNPTAETLTGWKSEELSGKKIEDVFQVFDTEKHERIPLTKPYDHETENFKYSKTKRARLKNRRGIMLEIHYSKAPIHLLDGRTFGYIIVFTDISELIEKQRQIEYLSFHDDLTGLYNRYYLRDALRRLDSKSKLPFTIMALDINGLKATNDQFGHNEGDKLIKLTADFLRSSLRQEDIIARFGGDEFCVLLPNTSAAVADSIKQRLLKSMAGHNTGKCTLSLSIGYAVKEDEAECIDSTLTRADRNMYKHKEKQKIEPKDLDRIFSH